jgi:hypothetical protein
LVEILERGDVLIDDGFVDQAPQRLGRLDFRGVGRLEDEANAFRDGEPGLAVPTGVVEHENDDPIASRAGFLSKQAQQRLEERLGYAVRDVPEDFAGGGRNERRDIEPFEPMMAVRGRPFADRRPDPPRHRF